MINEPLIDYDNNPRCKWNLNTTLLMISLMFLVYLTIYTILISIVLKKEEDSVLEDLYSVYGGKDQLLIFANKTRILVDYGCKLIPECKKIGF